MPREQLPGKVTGLAASWQLLGSTCALVGLQRAGKAVGADTGQDGPSSWPGVCAHLLPRLPRHQPRAALYPAGPGHGQSPPEDQLERIHHSRGCCGAQTAR